MCVHNVHVEDLANLAVDCVSADQSDFTEAICFNYIHSFAVALLCVRRWRQVCVRAVL